MRFEFSPTKDDYVKTTRSISAKNSGNTGWIDILFYLPLLIIYLVNVVQNPYWFASVEMIFVFLLLFFPLIIFGRIYLNSKKIAAQVRANPKLTQPATWDVDAEKICIDNPYGEIKINWETISATAENQEYYFLLYEVNRNTFQFLPKRLFDGRGNDETDFRKLLEDKLGSIRPVDVSAGYTVSLFVLGALFAVAILTFAISVLRAVFF